MINRSWPEVTLQAQDRPPDALARWEVDTRRTATSAREVQHDLIRVELGLEARVVHFEADIELRCRVPDGPQADCPDIPIRVATRRNRRTRERSVRSGKPTDRALRRRTEQRR